MISYYDMINELKETNIEELEKEMFKVTDDYLNKAAEKFKKEMFHEVSTDLENWMSERIDNTKRYFFDAVVNYLIGRRCTGIDNKDKETINDFLKEIGFSAESLRLKIYEENKETILKEITNDSIYECLENFNRSFKHWDLKDITTNYPQTDIIKKFIRYIVKIDGLENYIFEELNNEIKEKKEELKKLNIEINKLIGD
jgi:hypothetical protein